jgi:hypothetical protein
MEIFLVLGLMVLFVGLLMLFVVPPLGVKVILAGLLLMAIDLVVFPMLHGLASLAAGFWVWATHVGITPWPNFNGVLLSLIALLILGAIVFAIVSAWPAIVAGGGTVLTVLLVIGGIVLIIYVCVLLATWVFKGAGAATVIPMHLADLRTVLRVL